MATSLSDTLITRIVSSCRDSLRRQQSHQSVTLSNTTSRMPNRSNQVPPKGTPKDACIHSEILKRFPTVNAAIHPHSDAVVPSTISGVPLRPCFHMAGFLGTTTPLYDISEFYEPGERKDMLVSNTRLGGALAGHFGDSDDQPQHAAVLMRGHGFTVQGSSIMEAVQRAVYTQQNASIQTTALITRAAHFGSPSSHASGGEHGIVFLSEEESAGATEMTKWSVARPWRLWLREVEAAGLYVNTA